MEYTQEERAKGMNCPRCGFWHTARSCPPQNKARCRCRELEQEVNYLKGILLKIKRVMNIEGQYRQRLAKLWDIIREYDDR